MALAAAGGDAVEVGPRRPQGQLLEKGMLEVTQLQELHLRDDVEDALQDGEDDEGQDGGLEPPYEGHPEALQGPRRGTRLELDPQEQALPGRQKEAQPESVDEEVDPAMIPPEGDDREEDRPKDV